MLTSGVKMRNVVLVLGAVLSMPAFAVGLSYGQKIRCNVFTNSFVKDVYAEDNISTLLIGNTPHIKVLKPDGTSDILINRQCTILPMGAKDSVE